MFGLFKPKCPLNTWEKTWTETRWLWLMDRLGRDRLLKAQVITPTDEHFPDEYSGRPDQVRALLDRLCFHLGLDPLKIDLDVCTDEQLPNAAGQYVPGERPLIRVAYSQLAQPSYLLATLVHELAHELLIGGGHEVAELWDHEWITDLAMVYVGMGIFGANGTLFEHYFTAGQVSSWTIGRQGYLPSRIFGYALALFAWLRGESRPAWAEHLRLDALAAISTGMKFLASSTDVLVRPEYLQKPPARLAAAELVERLRHGSPSARLAAIWETSERGISDEAVVSAVIQCIDDHDPWIACEATRVLGGLGKLALAAGPRLVRALHDPHTDTRRGAAAALGQLQPDPHQVVPELAYTLQDPNLPVVQMAAWALGQFGPAAASAVSSLLPALQRALVECDHDLLDTLIGALCAISDDAKREVRAFFPKSDLELRRHALALLESPPPLSAVPPAGLIRLPSRTGEALF